MVAILSWPPRVNGNSLYLTTSLWYLSAVLTRFPKASTDLNSVQVILGGPEMAAKKISLYEEHIGQEWYEPWDKLDWMTTELWVQGIYGEY